MAIITVANAKGNPFPQVFITILRVANAKSPYPGFDPKTQQVVGSAAHVLNPRNLKDPYPGFNPVTQVVVGSNVSVFPVRPLPGGSGGGGAVGSPIDSG